MEHRSWLPTGTTLKFSKLYTGSKVAIVYRFSCIVMVFGKKNYDNTCLCVGGFFGGCGEIPTKLRILKHRKKYFGENFPYHLIYGKTNYSRSCKPISDFLVDEV